MDIFKALKELRERLEIVEEQYSDAIDFASGTGVGTGYIGIQYSTCIQAINAVIDIIDTVQEEATAEIEDAKRDEEDLIKEWNEQRFAEAREVDHTRNQDD